MKRALTLAAFAILASPLATAPVSANENAAQRLLPHSFTQARFEKAQKQDRLILVETYADWCAPCRIQAPIVERLRKEKRYRNLVLLRLDANTPRSVWKGFGLAGFGQFVVFRGQHEIRRGSPLTEREMRALLSEKKR